MTGRRVGALLGLALLAVLVLLAALTRGGTSGALEPGSYEPEGARALATLLEDRGVDVDRVEDPRAAGRAGAGTTVLVPFPALLTPAELDDLADGDAIVVLVEPDGFAVDALGGGLEVRGPLPVEPRRPACPLEQATRAGIVEIGGLTYAAEGELALGCYAGGGRAPLLALPDRGLVLLGTGVPLTNEALADEGAAALGLGLLGTGDRLLWLLPDPARALDGSAQRPLVDLLPEWVVPGAVQLGIAALVLALWRARQLGPPVAEPLPVVVRSAEAVEGRARLYQAARARDRAAEALRAAARARLARRLGALGSGPPERTALVGSVAARAGGDPAEVDAVLFGAAPRDDASLVALAAALDALEGAVAGAGVGSGA